MGEQLDFILLMHGLALVVLAAIMWARQRDPSSERMPWRWLQWFALLRGGSEWLDMLAISLGNSRVFETIRLVVLAASFLMLLEFGRVGLRVHGVRMPERWALLPMIALVGLGSPWGVSGLSVTSRYVLALPGALLAGAALLREGWSRGVSARNWFNLAGVAMLVHGLAGGLVGPRAAFAPATWLNEDNFLASTGLPIQLLGALCASVMTIGVSRAFSRNDAADGQTVRRFREWSVACGLLLVLSAGWWGTKISAQVAQLELRGRLLSQARSLARTVNPEHAAALSFTIADKTSHVFQGLREQMIACGPGILPDFEGCGYVGIYSVALRGGQLKFGPESIDSADSRASEPGTVYQRPPKPLLDAIAAREAVTFGPYVDEYGSMVSAFAPVFDSRSGEVHMMVGVDIMAEWWQREIVRQRLIPILFSMALSVLLVGGGLLLRRRSQIPEEEQGWLRHTETVATGLGGLLLAACVMFVVHRAETYSRREVFSQVAEAQAARVQSSLRDLQDYYLASLARFVEGEKDLTRERFRAFALPLARTSAIQAYVWAPCTSASQKAMLEEEARRQGLAGFTIFMKDAQGDRVPAKGRDELVPVYYTEPLEENEGAIGFDLSSEARRRAAMEMARRTGFTTATDPIILVQDNKQQTGLQVWHPIPGSTADGVVGRRPVRGFVLAVLRARALLEQLKRTAGSAAIVELFQLHPDKAPEFLASTDQREEVHHQSHPANFHVTSNEIMLTYPALAFGKSYAVVVHPGAGFVAAEPMRAALVAGLAALMLTSVVTAFVGFMSRRHGLLERQVRKRTADLHASRERFAQVAEQSREIIWEMDTEGRLTYISRACEMLLGYSRDDLVGKVRYFDLHPEQGRAEYVRGMQKAISLRQQLVDVSTRRVARDGRVLDVLVNGAPIVDGNGVLLGYRGSDRDVTARKQMEDSVRLAKEQVEESNARLQHTVAVANRLAEEAAQANRAKGEFLANMSHEIRTPMNGVMGMLELLLKTGLTDVQRRHADTAYRSADALLAILNDILDLSKIDAGRMELAPETCDLRSLVEDVGHLVAVPARGKDVEIIVGVAPSAPRWVRCDPVRLRQILTNLAGNAVKFTARGHVAISLACDDLKEGVALIHFAVKDTGIGIPADKIESIFEKFTQADSSTTRQFGGTGLGLTITRTLVQMMGGRIWVESKLGSGSTFHCTIPFAVAEPPTPSHPKAPIGLAGLHALVVDDNPVNRQVLEEILLSWKVRPLLAEGGPDALAKLRACAQDDPVQLAIVDMCMPEMDGVELCNEIVAQQGARPRGILLLSSSDHGSQAQRCRAANLDRYLVKPLRQDELLEAVLGTLGHRQHAAGSESVRPAGENPTRPLRILLAEDNVINQQIAVELLNCLGHTTFVAANGVQAVNAVQQGRFDLILMDMQMPEMNGLEATTKIRKLEMRMGERTPIIAMTANALAGDKERCISAGMDGYLTKPISGKQLAETIREFVPNESGSADASDSLQARDTDGACALGERPPINVQDLLGRCLHKPAIAVRVLETFQRTAGSLLDQIKRALESSNTEEAARHAHTLKGAAASISAEALRTAIAEVERLSKAGAEAAARSRVPELELAFDRCLVAIPRVCGSIELGV